MATTPSVPTARLYGLSFLFAVAAVSYSATLMTHVAEVRAMLPF